MRRAVALLLAAAVSVQCGAAFAVQLFDRLGPGGTVFLRLALSAVVLVVVFRPRMHGRSPAELRLAIALGVVLGLMNWSFYEAIARIPLGPTVTLEFVGPLSVGLWGSRRPLDLVWVALAAVGVVALAGGGWDGSSGGLDPAGVALALAAGACWAVYILLSARTGRVWPGVTGLAFGMGFGALVALPAGIHQGGGELLHPALIAGGLVVALASSVIPYSLDMVALRTLPEHVFGVLMSLDPAIASLAGLVVLGQGLSGGDVAAIAAVVIASIGVTTAAAQRTGRGSDLPVRAAAERSRSG